MWPRTGRPGRPIRVRWRGWRHCWRRGRCRGRTTARDIATVSGANLASIGYYYGSKDALLTTAVLEIWDDWGNVLEAAIQNSAGDTPMERLEAIVESIDTGLAANRETLVASFQAMAQAEFSEEVRERIERQYEEGRYTLAAGVLGIDEDDLTDEDLSLGSLVLLLVNGYSVESYAVPEQRSSFTGIAGALRLLVGDDLPGADERENN